MERPSIHSLLAFLLLSSAMRGEADNRGLFETLVANLYEFRDVDAFFANCFTGELDVIAAACRRVQRVAGLCVGERVVMHDLLRRLDLARAGDRVVPATPPPVAPSRDVLLIYVLASEAIRGDPATRHRFDMMAKGLATYSLHDFIARCYDRDLALLERACMRFADGDGLINDAEKTVMDDIVRCIVAAREAGVSDDSDYAYDD